MNASIEACATDLCERVDWRRPELAGTAFAEAWRAGDGPAAAIGFVRHLRERTQPHVGYDAAWVGRLRAAATNRQRQDAVEGIETALGAEAGARQGALVGVEALTLQLGADESHLRRAAEAAAAGRDDWATPGLGSTGSIVSLLRAAWPLEACPDEALVAYLAWLPAQVDADWAWSRTWGDTILGTAGHNFWASTFGGLWQAGLLFPELEGVGKFAAFAPTWLEREANLCFAPDGFTRERSGYHWGTVNHLLDAVELARRNGVRFSEGMAARLRRIGEVNWKLVAPDGDLPCVGDTGKSQQPGRLLLRLRHDAALLGSAEAKWVAERLDPGWQPPYAELLPAFGRDLWPAHERCEPAAPPSPDTSLPDSGYYVMRDDWSTGGDWACLDAGARGNTVTSHDHASIFHLLLYARGRPILLDNCSGPYADDRPERHWRIGSTSHNMATVDGEPAIAVASQWRWAQTVCPTIDAWRSEPTHAYFSGAHEGYGRLDAPVPATRRKLFYLRGQYWILIDRFASADPEAEHAYELHFHLGPEAELGEAGRATTRGEGGNLLILPVPGAAGDGRLEPNPYPLEGYDNPSHLRYEQRIAGHGLFVTLLAPFTDNPPAASVRLLEIEADGRVLDPWEATALEIEIDGRRDVYFDPHTHWNLPWRAGGFEGSGRLFHSRVGRPD